MLREVTKSNPPVDEVTLTSFEACHNLALPSGYREFILESNGGRPVPPGFPIHGLQNNPAGVIQAVFGLNASIRSHDIALILRELEHLIPPGILPIACTDGDDYLCIDLRKPGCPVVFWDRRSFWGTDLWNEDDLYAVAGNFEELLASLHEI